MVVIVQNQSIRPWSAIWKIELRPVQTKPTSYNILAWANNVTQCWTKILSKFKLKPTSSNIIQHSVHARPTCCIQQCWKMLDQQYWLRLNRPLGLIFTDTPFFTHNNTSYRSRDAVRRLAIFPQAGIDEPYVAHPFGTR